MDAPVHDAVGAIGETFLTAVHRAKLSEVFARMERPLILRGVPDENLPSADLRRMLEELAGLTEKLTVEWLSTSAGTGTEDLQERPCVRVLREDGNDTGIAFHGVPGGHEFNSFVVALYNAAGPGQPLPPELSKAIAALNGPLDLKILVSLSCPLCPELVIAAQRIAAIHPLVRAEAYDANLFPALRERYQVMNVPCLIIDDGKKEQVLFGKKSLEQLVELLQQGGE